MPLLDLFWAMMWFFLWIIWLWMLIAIYSDIFSSHDLSGWGKAGWTIFTLVLPFLGVFVYLIARGRSMAERSAARAAQADEATRSYIREVATASPADELETLARLRESGALTEDEFRQQKTKILAA